MGEGLRSSVHTSQCHGYPMDCEWAVKWIKAASLDRETERLTLG